MKSTRTAILLLALAGAFTSFMVMGLSAPAEAGVSKKQAMAACRAKYGKDVTSVVIKKNGQIVCQEGPSGKSASRAEVYEWCKRKFGATTVVVQKKGDRWHCLYYGRY
jgi:hypothetical protein